MWFTYEDFTFVEYSHCLSGSRYRAKLCSLGKKQGYSLSYFVRLKSLRSLITLTSSCLAGSEKLKSIGGGVGASGPPGDGMDVSIAVGAGAGRRAASVTRAEEGEVVVEVVVAVAAGVADVADAADAADALGVTRAEESEVLKEVVEADAAGVAEVVVGEDSVAETAAASFLFLC